MKRVKLGLLSLICLAALSLFAGCGGGGGQTPEEWSPSDEDDVRHVISEVSAARSNPEKQAEVFSQVPSKDWVAATQGKSFELNDISIDGDEATANMSIQDFDGNELSQQQWKCVRDGETWKVADAPLGQ